MTKFYIRQYIQQKYGVNPTEKMVDEAESAVNEYFSKNSDEKVNDEIFDLVYKTFTEYLSSIAFRSFYKDTYIDLPDISAREIDRHVRNRAVKTGKDPSDLTGSSIPLSKLLDERQLENLYTSGQDITSEIQHEAKRIKKEGEDDSLGFRYTRLDVWIGKCNYHLSQRDWSSLSSEHLSNPQELYEFFRLRPSPAQ